MTLRSSRSHDELIQASREPLPEEFRPPRAPDFEKDWYRLWCDIFEEWSKELGVPLPKPVMPKPQRIRLPRLPRLSVRVIPGLPDAALETLGILPVWGKEGS